MSDEVATLRTMYERFNARDVEGVLSALDEGVVWANGMDGGHVRGCDEVRAYWARQWAAVRPRVEPLRFDTRGIDEVVVDVRQAVYDLEGNLLPAEGGLLSQDVRHLFRFVGGRVARFDIEKIT